MYLFLQWLHIGVAILLMYAPMWRRTGLVLLLSAYWNMTMLPGPETGAVYYAARAFSDAWAMAAMVWASSRGWKGQALILSLFMSINQIAFIEWYSPWVLLLPRENNIYGPTMDLLNVIQLVLPMTGIRQGGINALAELARLAVSAGILVYSRVLGLGNHCNRSPVVARHQREKKA